MVTDATDNAGMGASARLRLAVISTPRSGNTWVRMQLASLLELEQIAAHFPDEIDWDQLPERCVLQIHWYPIPEFVDRLAEYGVRVVVLARHPLDVLMSWLNLAYYKHEDGRCPGNGACTECGLVGVAPGSQALVDYASSYYGRVMLCYSPAWWNVPGVARARYEDFLAAPAVALKDLAEQLNAAPRKPIAEVVAQHALAEMRKNPEVWRFHCWQGQEGLWRRLIPASSARAIREGVPEPFDVLGYPCDPDESLDPTIAEFHWARIQLDSVRDHLSREREKQAALALKLTQTREALEQVRATLRDEQRAHTALTTPPALESGSLGWWQRLPGLNRWLRTSPAASPFVPRPHYPSSAAGVSQPERAIAQET